MSISVLLAGGGTGGHVFPLLAVADAIRQLQSDSQLLFVGTRRGLEGGIVPAKGYPIEFVDILPIRGRGMFGAMRGAAQAISAMPQSARLIKRVRPDVVLSVGGYAAGPVTLAAWANGIATALLEPNSEMGLSNLCLAFVVDRAYTAFESVERHFNVARVLRAGVPLRSGFGPQPWVEHPGPLRLLVLGGSQGASSLNEAVPLVVGSAGIAIEVRHQCGKTHVDRVRELYGRLDPAMVSVEPFIEDMPGALAWADIVVSRAGASAVSEICAVGRASLLIPYPFAAGDHQAKNAQALAKAGAAVWLDSKTATPESIRDEILRLARDGQLIQRMSDAARALGRPDAAMAIAKDILELASHKRSENHKSQASASSRPRAEA